MALNRFFLHMLENFSCKLFRLHLGRSTEMQLSPRRKKGGWDRTWAAKLACAGCIAPMLPPCFGDYFRQMRPTASQDAAQNSPLGGGRGKVRVRQCNCAQAPFYPPPGPWSTSVTSDGHPREDIKCLYFIYLSIFIHELFWISDLKEEMFNANFSLFHNFKVKM